MRVLSGAIAVLATILIGILSASAEPTYVQAGSLLDVERSRILENYVIKIEGERISEMSPEDEMPIPQGALLIDLSEYTVLPGLIDAHVHLLDDADEQGYRGLSVSIPDAAIKGVKNAKITLEAGFTSARVVGAPGYGDVALRNAIDSGDVIGPRLVVAGPPVGMTGGHCSDGNLLPSEYDYTGEGVADGPWAARAMVRRNLKYGVDMIKTCSTGGVLSKGTKVGASQYTLEELEALVDEAHIHGLKVASHAHGTEGILNAIKAGVDSVEHASFIDEEGIRLAKRNGTTLVMDIYVTDFILSEGAAAGMLEESLEKERLVGQRQRDNFREAHQAGVNIVFGTDAAVYPHGQNARQFAIMVQYGMTSWEALQAATIKASALLGTDANTGTLETGKYADIIAVEGDVLDDVSLLESIPFVMKGGAVIKAPEY